MGAALRAGFARRSLRGGLALCAVALALGCGDALSGTAGAGWTDPPIADVAPSLPAIEIPTPPDAAEPARLAAAAPVRRAPAIAKQAEPAPAEIHVPLDSLLRTPVGSAALERTLDLGVNGVPEVEPSAPHGAIDGWKQRVQLERRVEPIGRAGPRQGTHTEIDAALRIPIDESLSVKGGVRVDERAEPGAAAPERRSTPRVGVEVRF